MNISFIPTYVTKKDNVTDFKTLDKIKKVRTVQYQRYDEKTVYKHFITVPKFVHPRYKNWLKRNVRWKKTRELLYHFCIDNVPQYYEGKFMCQTPYKEAMYVSKSDMQLAYLIANSKEEFPFTVQKFSYNGFGGTHDKNVIMKYKAKFIRWSGDPGIMVMMCSDKKERYIPTYAVPGSFILKRTSDYNKQTLFGMASES